MATGGVGEAMLIGALTGAGTSAVTGGDPLKGALFGGLGGAIMPGIGSALSGGSGAAAGTAGTAAATGAVEGAAASALPGMGAEQAAAYFGGPGGTFAGIAPPPVIPGVDAQQAAAMFGGPQFQYNIAPTDSVIKGGGSFFTQAEPSKGAQGIASLIQNNPKTAASLGGSLANTLLNQPKFKMPGEEGYEGPLNQFNFDPYKYQAFIPRPPQPPYTARYANGGIAGTEMGMYPQSQFDKTQYAVPSQMPTSAEVIAAGYEPKVNPYTGEPRYSTGGKLGLEKIEDLISEAKSSSGGIASLMSKARADNPDALAAMQKMQQQKQMAAAHKKGLAATRAAEGGLMDSDLGSYSDGGRLLKGPGDGMSDDIPARIGRSQPARLADGEFVIPADVVSGLGNGSTDAGAKQLYAMMDRVRKSRTGTKKQGKEIKPMKYVPA